MNIYKENKMLLDMPDSLTLVKRRTQVKQTFDEEVVEDITSGGQVLRCSWNTGEFMVDPSQSSLIFTISVKDTSAGAFNFGSFGAISIFRQIIIRSASGVEVCRLDEPALFSKLKFQLETDFETEIAMAEAMGTPNGANVYTWQGYSGTPTKATKHKFIIPLEYLTPLFCPISSDTKYMPSQLAEGLTFEFYLNSVNKAITGQATTVSYNIHSISFLLDAVILNDRSLAELQNKCHKKGLEWVCKGVHKQDIRGVLGGEDVSNQISFSVSQALRCVTFYRQSDQQDSVTSDKGRMINVAPSFIARSGADYYPQQRVDDRNNADPIETFNQTKYTFPKMSMAIYIFKTTAAYYAVNLNMSDFLELSGVIVNNSKTLEYLGSGNPDAPYNTTPYDVTTLLDYVKVVKIVGRNVAVAI
jgi:hypothetical protein